MKYYYLINNRIMSANEKMPEINEQWHTYNANLLKWSESLQPCEISESELDKIIKSLSKKQQFQNASIPIEVTEIVESKVTHQLLSMPPIDCYELFFKQPSDNNGVITFKNKLPKASERTEETMYNIKQVEEIEAVAGYVAFNVNGIISGIYSNLEWLKEDYPKSGYYKLTTLRNI